jgi:hypothetical protein
MNSILLGTENPEPLVAFYTKVLGPPDGNYFQVASPMSMRES